MTREEIISGLNFTIKMFLFDPTTGETITEPRNDMDKITIDACKGAIELLEQEPFMNKPCVAYQVCHEDKVKVLDNIRAEIIEEKDYAYADFEQYKVDYFGVDAEYAEDELPQDDFRYGMERAIDIIDKYIGKRK